MASEPKSFSVLVLKKDHDDLHFLKKSLDQNPEFPSKVDFTADIDEALRKIHSEGYHLFVIESEEPKETEAVLSKLEDVKPEIPFVLFLPVKDDSLVRQAMRCGVADVIIKSEHQFHDLAQKLRKSLKEFHRTHPFRRADDVIFESNESQEVKLPQFSIRDELTGLYSHGYLFERIVREFSRAQRYNFPISCVMIGLDHFKKINETYGYYSGERVIKESADLLFENCRMSDFIARYSGKEFCMILPHSGYEGTKELSGRLRQVFEKHVFEIEGHKIQVTISIGIAAFPEDTITQRVDLVRFANEALHQAKAHGGNRVNLFKEMVPVTMEDLPSLQISEERINEFQHRMTEINSNFRKAYLDASKTLIYALENKDRHTAGHSASTAKYAFWLAQAVGMNRDEAETVRHAALLHDIGKICIPDHILLKPGRLTLTEFESMKQHPYLGYKMLKPIKFLQQEALMVLHHHEWFNGEGYPCRLKGAEIPLGARIIALVDSFDTIRTAGSRYKKTMTLENTLNELISCAGTQFDPEVVKAFIEVLRLKGELKSDDFIPEKVEAIFQAKALKPASSVAKQ